MTRIVPTLGVGRLEALARSVPHAIPRASFLFLRHGETDGNLNRYYQTEDQPLNATGEAQAAAAARILSGQGVADIVASPMPRAWRTASLAAEHHALAPRPEPRIKERVYTALFGQPNADFDWAHDPAGCETLDQFVSRVRDGLSDALQAPVAPGRERLVVAHGGVLLVLVAMLGASLGPGLDRNATPMRFAPAGAGWAAERLA